MNGYCNSCDNHCATNEMRCERGYRAMGYEMGREMSGAMIRNMQHAQPPRDFREIGQRFADDVARQARGGGFEAKARRFADDVARQARGGGFGAKARRFADDAARAAREAQALREAGRKLAEAIAANAGEAGETEATRESAKHFAETVAANIGESARAEALRQAAGKLAEAVAKAAGEAGEAEAMRASVQDFAKTVAAGATESAQVEALREATRRLAEAVGVQTQGMNTGGSSVMPGAHCPGMGMRGLRRGPMGPGFRTLPVRPGEGPREDRGRGFGGRFHTLPAHGGPSHRDPWDVYEDVPNDFYVGPWGQVPYDFEDSTEGAYFDGPRGFDHGFGGHGGLGGCGPGDGFGPGGRGPGMPPRGGRPPFGRPPRPMPDGEMLRERIDEAGLAELLELSGRLMHHRPGAGSARGQNLVLSILAGRKTMSQRELQQMLAVQPGSISEIVSKLEKKGYVIREKAEDKRGNLLNITEAGIKAIPQAQAEPEDELFAALDEAQRKTLAELLRTLLNDWAEKLDAAPGRGSVRGFAEAARRAQDKGPGVKV